MSSSRRIQNVTSNIRRMEIFFFVVRQRVISPVKNIIGKHLRRRTKRLCNPNPVRPAIGPKPLCCNHLKKKKKKCLKKIVIPRHGPATRAIRQTIARAVKSTGASSRIKNALKKYGKKKKKIKK